MTDKPTPQPSLRIAFTDKALKALPPAEPGRGRYRVLAEDEPGLLVRVTESGAKTAYINRRAANSSRPLMVKLCAFRVDRSGRGNLAEIRRLWAEKIKLLDAGMHPLREAKKQETHDFGGVAEAWIRCIHADEQRQARGTENTMRRYFLGQKPHRVRDFGQKEFRVEWRDSANPVWRSRELHKIDRTAVRERLQSVAAHNPWEARHAHATLSRFYRWVVEAERFGVETSPVAEMRQFRLTPKMTRRKRVLTHAELKAVWDAAGTLNVVYGTLVRVLLLTGQRKSDWSKAKRSELAHDGVHMLVVPGERYKNSEVHEVPLTPKVRELLAGLPAFAGSDWLFSVTGRQHFNEFSKSKARLDRASGVTGWKIHDLRRTCRTGLGTLRVPRDVAERVIGHTLGELDEIYDQGSHREAKYEALLAWEQRLMTIVGETPPRGLRLVVSDSPGQVGSTEMRRSSVARS